MNIKTPTLISTEYAIRLFDQYDHQHVNDVLSVREALLLKSGDTSGISYSRINEGDGIPTLYIPGFTEGITSKAPLALELASDVFEPGLDVIIPDQHRIGIDTNGFTKRGRAKKDATYSQALNYLEILKVEVGDGPVNVITHSYGSLIFQAMAKIAKERDLGIFESVDVVMLSPAGFNDKDSSPRLGWRFLRSMISELKSTKEFPDQNNELMKAGIRILVANPRRSWSEIRALAREKVNPEELFATGVGSLAVMVFGQDKLFPQKVLDSKMKRAVDAGVSYMTPVSISNETSAVDGATHNDDQFNPRRVSNAVKQYLTTIK